MVICVRNHLCKKHNCLNVVSRFDTQFNTHKKTPFTELHLAGHGFRHEVVRSYSQLIMYTCVCVYKHASYPTYLPKETQGVRRFNLDRYTDEKKGGREGKVEYEGDR